MTVTIETLRKLPLFHSLTSSELAQVAPLLRDQAVVAGQAVVQQGEPCSAVYFVAKGLLRTRRISHEGREQVLGYLGPGNAVGIVTVLDRGNNPATVDAVLPSLLYAISCEDLQRIVGQHHAVAVAVAEYLAGEVRRLSEMVEDLALHTVRSRLARFLLTRATDPAGPGRWTQEDIAVNIGTVREMIARTLRVMSSEGLIRRERGRIVIVDRARLEQEAGTLQ